MQLTPVVLRHIRRVERWLTAERAAHGVAAKSVLVLEVACVTMLSWFAFFVATYAASAAVLYVHDWKRSLTTTYPSGLQYVDQCPVASAPADVAHVFRPGGLSFSRRAVLREGSLHFCDEGPSCNGYFTQRFVAKNKQPFINVRVVNGSVVHDDPDLALFPSRVHDIIDSLKVAVRSPYVPRSVDVPLLIYSANDCPRRETTVPVLAYAFSRRLDCHRVMPAPFFPREDNTLFGDIDFADIESGLQEALSNNPVVPWNHKISMAIWRGWNVDGGASQWDSGRGLRSKLTVLSTIWPQIFDAAFMEPAKTSHSFKSSLNLSLSLPGKPMPFRALMKYKYVIDLPGLGASTHMSSLFMGSSSVILADVFDTWFTYIFRNHNAVTYIARDLSNIVPVLRSIQAKDDSSRMRALQMSDLSRKCFRTKVLNYHWGLLLKWYDERLNEVDEVGE